MKRSSRYLTLLADIDFHFEAFDYVKTMAYAMSIQEPKEQNHGYVTFPHIVAGMLTPCQLM
jgi:hypothetical protein